jgi:phosphonate transport system substrate-binding protein
MHTLSIVSLMAANALPIYRGVAHYLSRQSGLRVTLIEGLPWHEQVRLLDRGKAEIGIICGLLYIHKTTWLDLLAAPVMRAARYQRRPIYFSDIVVPHDSRFQSFADLRGARWLYNDRGSFSGYAVLRAHLAALGESGDFCGRIWESGGHLRSLALVGAGAADAAAIDSTVLEFELKRRPELASQIRVVATIGPHPIPPVVVAKHMPAELMRRLRAALLQMHEDVQGSEILADGLIERFVAVRDCDYNQLRLTARSAEQVHFHHHSE